MRTYGVGHEDLAPAACGEGPAKVTALFYSRSNQTSTNIVESRSKALSGGGGASRLGQQDTNLAREEGRERREKQAAFSSPSSMALGTTTLFLHLLPKHSFPPVVCLYSTATGERREKGQFRSRSESFPPLEHRWEEEEEEEEEEEAARKTGRGIRSLGCERKKEEL